MVQFRYLGHKMGKPRVSDMRVCPHAKEEENPGKSTKSEVFNPVDRKGLTKTVKSTTKTMKRFNKKIIKNKDYSEYTELLMKYKENGLAQNRSR